MCFDAKCGGKVLSLIRCVFFPSLSPSLVSFLDSPVSAAVSCRLIDEIYFRWMWLFRTVSSNVCNAHNWMRCIAGCDWLPLLLPLLQPLHMRMHAFLNASETGRVHEKEIANENARHRWWRGGRFCCSCTTIASSVLACKIINCEFRFFSQSRARSIPFTYLPTKSQ